jgi:hypothetical protein
LKMVNRTPSKRARPPKVASHRYPSRACTMALTEFWGGRLRWSRPFADMGRPPRKQVAAGLRHLRRTACQPAPSASPPGTCRSWVAGAVVLFVPSISNVGPMESINPNVTFLARGPHQRAEEA